MVLNGSLPDVEIVEAGSLNEAMRLQQAPTLLLLDIQLPGLNGLDGLTLIHRQWPDVPVVMLSSQAEPESVRQALARGARAFVSKAETASRIISVLRQVLQDSPHSLPLVPRDFSSHAAGDEAAGDAPRLTARQCEVLDHLSQGHSNKVIGRDLGLSENTVRGHVQAILGFLQVSSRSEAIVVARRRGLVN